MQECSLTLSRCCGGIYSPGYCLKGRRSWSRHVRKGGCSCKKFYLIFLAVLLTLQVLGMIQNMSIFICPHCNESTHIFGSNGVERECAKHNMRFLGDIPLHGKICDDADHGKPTVVSEPGNPRADAFTNIAATLSSLIGL